MAQVRKGFNPLHRGMGGERMKDESGKMKTEEVKRLANCQAFFSSFIFHPSAFQAILYIEAWGY